MRSKTVQDDGGNSDRGTPSDRAPAGGSPRSLAQILWRGKWWILLSTVTSVAVAVFYLSRTVPIYSSSASVYVQQFNPVGKSAGENLGSKGGPSAAQGQAELVRSEAVLDAVAKLPEVGQMKMMAGASNPLPTIQSNLGIAVDGDFIRVSVESPYPEEAALLVNLVVQEYQDLNDKKMKGGDSAEVVAALRAELKKANAELDDRVNKSIEFRRKNGVISFSDEKGNIVMQKLAKLSEALTQGQLDAMEADAIVKSVEAMKADQPKLLDVARAELERETRSAGENGDGRTLDMGDPLELRMSATSDLLRQEIESAERLLARLRRTRTPEHKDVQEAEADLAGLKERLAQNEREIAGRKERIEAERQNAALRAQSTQNKAGKAKQDELDRQLIAAYVAKVTRRADLARQRVAMLQSDFDKQRDEAFKLNEKQAEFTVLETEQRRSERFVQLLQDKLRDIKVSEDTGVLKTTISEVARPAAKPIRPDRNRVLGTALLVGLILGGGLAFGLDSMDQRLRNVDEIVAAVDVPVLGVVPHIEQAQAAHARGRKVLLEPTSDVAESYRTIRTAIYFAERAEGAKRLLVTSPAPGDGKSTTASNLAIAMAQAGRRVVIVDADFRRPTQHKIFGLPDDATGMSGVMAGLDPLDAAIHRTTVETLDVVPCGRLPANPAEILNGRGFADALAQLARDYDHVVIDSPPVAPVTDARILGALADETVLVLRANKSTRKLARHAREGLDSVGAQIIGVIVNDVASRKDRYGYYYGGYGYYGYGAKDGANGNGSAHALPGANGNGSGMAHGDRPLIATASDSTDEPRG